MEELKQKEYKRKNFKNFEMVETLSDTSDVFDIAIEALEKTKTRPPKFSNDEEGLARFKEMSLEFIKELRKRNIEAENSKRMRLIPSIEMWATYLGITRQTIHTYERTYNKQYNLFILQFKNVIATIKKELAENGKIPPIIHIFDFVNNFQYLNTNNVTINSSAENNEIYEIPSERLNNLLDGATSDNDSEGDSEGDLITDLPCLDRKGDISE